MLEAIFWITAFLLVLLLTWFIGKHYAEKIAARKILRKRQISEEGAHQPELGTILSDASLEPPFNDRPRRAGKARIRLAAMNGKLVDSEDGFADASSTLNKASK